jgi:hypothetical protein
MATSRSNQSKVPPLPPSTASPGLLPKVAFLLHAFNQPLGSPAPPSSSEVPILRCRAEVPVLDAEVAR